MIPIEIIENTATMPIGLAELVEYLDENLDPLCPETLLKLAPVFGRLYLNKELVKNHIVESLQNGISLFEQDNSYAPPSIILYRTEKYMIRANLWRATQRYSGADVNSYGLGHDHNFDFLTLSYSGPGYRSKMYTYDYGQVKGHIGEQIELQDMGTLHLKKGEMFLYQKNYHVHRQIPPDTNSITINLIIIPSRHDAAIQYLIDENQSVIIGANGGFYAQKHIFDMAKMINDEECNNLLAQISSTTTCHLTREYLSGVTPGNLRLL